MAMTASLARGAGVGRGADGLYRADLGDAARLAGVRRAAGAATWLGAPLIVASGLYIVWREHVRRRTETAGDAGESRLSWTRAASSMPLGAQVHLHPRRREQPERERDQHVGDRQRVEVEHIVARQRHRARRCATATSAQHEQQRARATPVWLSACVVGIDA